MEFLSEEKRKNDSPRRFQWWLLLIGFVLGVLVAIAFTPSRIQTITVFSTGNADTLYLTATAIIDSVTGTAQSAGVNQSSLSASIEPFAATATYIIEQATQQAAMSTPMP
jgi:hypothetical protein